MSRPSLALAHDYLTQRGGAERVVASWINAWPDAPLFTSLYDAEGTFPEFAAVHQLHTSPLNHISYLRRHHRAALPFLAPTFSRTNVDADVTLASSSGWAHGVHSTGGLVVYCHAPARWLYQGDRYFARGDLGAGAGIAKRLLMGPLRRWDQRAATRADRYVANSTFTRNLIREVYERDAEIIAPPVNPPISLPVETDRFDVLVVARLLPYKNVDVVLDIARDLPDVSFRIIGDGPLAEQLRAVAPPNVQFVGAVPDVSLWQHYVNCRVHLAISYEDFGITPLEACAAGRPTVARAAGGYLDTVTSDVGTLVPDDADFVQQTQHEIQVALGRSWSPADLRAHVGAFSAEAHITALSAVIEAVRHG